MHKTYQFNRFYVHKTYTSAKMANMNNEQRLAAIAQEQEGFFTTRQAKEAGYLDENISKMVKSGKWIREVRGIYRLAIFPLTERPELIIWSLWSCNRQGEVEGVWSHETALDIYDISDANPVKMHLSVPRGFRSKAPDFIILHQNNLAPSEIDTRKGYRVTTPMRTLVDLFKEGALSQDLLSQSIHEMVDRGLITSLELQKSRKFYPEIVEILEFLND